MMNASKIYKLLLVSFYAMTSLLLHAQTDNMTAPMFSEEDSIIAVYNAKNTDPATMDFHIVYIDHEPNPATNPNQLCKRIYNLRNDAAEMGNALVVYLANDDVPMLSFTNLPDPNEQGRDSLEAFDNIIQAIQRVSSHNVNATVDVNSIKELIGAAGAFPLFTEVNGEDVLRYKSVTIDFYVGPRFWNLRHNDNIIAQIYVILGLSKFMKKYSRKQLSFNIFKAQGQVLNYPKGMPFGPHNKDGINDNEKVNLNEY